MTTIAAVAGLMGRLVGRDPASLRREESLIVDLELDSPRILELMLEIEEALGSEISDEDASRLDTVGAVLDYVEKRSAG